MRPGYNIPTRGRPPTKKALLIGIEHYNHKDYRRALGSWRPIPTSIPNVNRIATFLRERCGYTDITIMTDDDGVEERYQPTKHNLRREIKALCRGAQPGDRRVFYFAGHSDQMPCLTGSEEDGMDEVLVAANGLRIRDNTLNNWMVKRLPKGSALTAIFDSCTSGTLLDLDHYKCNNVYRPWVNKGGRRSNTLRNNVVRKNCKGTRSGPPSRALSIYRKGSDMYQTFMPVQSTKESDKHFGERCMSPEREFECEGWCRNTMLRRATLGHPDVISISSSNDGQASYDASTRNGESISMTSYLIDILEQTPQITYSELMIRLNHAVHSFTRTMHDTVKRGRRARRAEGGNTDSEDTEPEGEFQGEMDNFQDLQLGSITPVDMDRLFMF